MIRLLSTLVLTFVATLSALPQSGPGTELAIRTAASAPTTQKTDDFYFFSGAIEKPVVGKTEHDKSSLSVKAERKNEKYTQTPDRIVVAPSGDMAYEYGTSRGAFDEVKSGKHQDFTAAYLRVWKAADGSCKVAAAMFEEEGKE